MNFQKKYSQVSYSSLNSKQRENYNFHKVAATLADYGFNSLRLNDDWQGADFIAVHISGNDMIKIQLKGRFTMDKKYVGKDLYIAFLENKKVKLYYHDDAINMIPENIENSTSWIRDGLYTWGKTPLIYEPIISILN
jgi:hypothetical protein